jgi:hypothetical protein
MAHAEQAPQRRLLRKSEGVLLLFLNRSGKTPHGVRRGLGSRVEVRETSMNSRRNIVIAAAVATALLACPAVAQGQAAFEWKVVTDNMREIPGFAGRTLNSYNDPSVNSQGLVVFRARSTGKQGGPIRGIFARDMGEGLPMEIVYLAQSEVPWPNNTAYNSNAGRFNEFPSFARVDAGSPTIVTRGQSQPTWGYEVDGEEARVGTSGVYVYFRGEQLTAMTQLGAVPGFEYYSVPGAELYTRFEQFPGAPAVMDQDTIAFKGNFSVGDQGYTGVYFRNVRRDGGMAPVTLVASSLTTDIPGLPGTRFGSTAPPSATDGDMVFVGLDNEESPTRGGIYRASLEWPTALEPLVTLGTQVPGENQGVKFTRFGESLALGDQARFVAFWGAWGTDIRYVDLVCPAEGNKDRRAYCKEVCAEDGICQDHELPASEGIFVYDSKSKAVVPVAKVGQDGIETFLYCKFSGRAPGASSGCGGGSGQDEGTGGPGQGHGGPGGSGQGQGGEGEGGGGSDFDTEEDGELARWRCGAYVALASRGAAYYQVAYKAQRNDETGLYLWDSRPKKPLQKVLETGMDASVLDPNAAGMKIASFGIERDGFRKGWVAITASMAAPASDVEPAAEDGHADEAEGNAGIYLTRVPGWSDLDE